MADITHLKSSPPRARGMALIIALLLLVILTVLGVASMSGVVMQERMAGNVNLQSWAFEAASAGVSEALEYVDSEVAGDCVRGEPWADPGPWSDVRFIGQNAGLPAGIEVSYRLRAGCFSYADGSVLDEEEERPVEFLVLSQGEVRRQGEAQPLAVREIEVRVGRTTEADCLFTVGPLGGPDPFGKGGSTGKSGAYMVDGGDNGCPIQFANAADASAFRAQLGDNTEQWQPDPPSISSGPLHDIWADPARLARAMNAIKVGIRSYNAWQPAYLDGTTWDTAVDGPPPFSACAGALDVPDGPNNVSQCINNPNQRPTSNTRPSHPNMTYVAGRLNLSGSGAPIAGVVFIENSFRTGGTGIAYQADLIALGGIFDGSGLGGTDNKGMVHLHNLSPKYAPSTTPECASQDERRRAAYNPALAEMIPSTTFRLGGGGNALIEAEDCLIIKNRWNHVNNCLATLQGMTETASPVSGFVSLYDYHISQNTGLAPIAGDLLLDFGDDPDSVRFPDPRCGDDLESNAVIASWREYIDRARWE